MQRVMNNEYDINLRSRTKITMQYAYRSFNCSLLNFLCISLNWNLVLQWQECLIVNKIRILRFNDIIIYIGLTCLLEEKKHYVSHNNLVGCTIQVILKCRFVIIYGHYPFLLISLSLFYDCLMAWCPPLDGSAPWKWNNRFLIVGQSHKLINICKPNMTNKIHKLPLYIYICSSVALSNRWYP